MALSLREKFSCQKESIGFGFITIKQRKKLQIQPRILTQKTKYIPDKKKKKRIQYSLKNCNQLRVVDKIFIFEHNFLEFLSVIDKYLDL